MKGASVLVFAMWACLPALPAQAATIPWDAGAGDSTNWSNPANWNPDGVPLAADTAQFNVGGADARTVTLDIDTPIDTVQVGGATAWTFAGTAMLTVATAFDYSDTSAGTFNAELGGAMSLNVSAGMLVLNNSGNTFSGGIHIAGGVLVAGSTSVQSDRTLGLPGGAIALGDSSGCCDATLAFYGNATGLTYAKAITIQAGSSGKATLQCMTYGGDNQNTIVLSNTITLHKDLTLFNDTAEPIYVGRRVFDITGQITGTGNLTKTGIGVVKLDGNDNYAGVTTIKEGVLALCAGAKSFAGDLHVDAGALEINTDARLGASGNQLTLGSPGRLGTLYAYAGDLVTSRTIALNGNGGSLIGPVGFTFNGTITGSGMLLQDCAGATTNLNAANSYTGGTRLVFGLTFANNNVSALGTGGVVIDQSAQLYISGPNSIASPAGVLVRSSTPDNSGFGTIGLLSMPCDLAAVPAIAAASSGFLAVGGAGSTSSAVNALLAGAVGNGCMFIGKYGNETSNTTIFTGSGLAIGAGNTYRLLAGGTLTFSLDAAGATSGVLADPDASTHANVAVGTLNNYALAYTGTVWSCDNQTFTGNLTVINATYGGNTLGAAGQSPLGSPGGAVSLIAGNLQINGASGGAPVSKGTLSYEAHSQVIVNATNATYTPSLTVASLGRVNNSVLYVTAQQGSLGNREKFIVTAAPAESNGMAAPNLLSGANDFLDYDTTGSPSNGFIPVVYKVNGLAGVVSTQAAFDGTVARDIVQVAGTDVSVSGTKTLQALKTDSQLIGSGTLTLAGGGLILTGRGKTHTINLSTSGEMVIDTATSAGHAGDQYNAISGAISAAGLTKTGAGALILASANPGLCGDLTIDQGSVEIGAASQLGNISRIVLNNWTGQTWTDGLRLNSSTAMNLSQPILVGAGGGLIWTSGNQTLSGKIGGTGPLTIWTSSAVTFTNGASDYSGGTVAQGGIIANAPGTAITGPLGTGAVVAEASLSINNDTACRNNRIIVTSDSRQPRIDCNTAAPVIGSLEGGAPYGVGQYSQGVVTLNASGCVLSLGGNNLSTDFYGQIVQADGANAGITKVGAGTFTTWGPNIYTGPTTIYDGRIDNNNLIIGPVNVTGVSGSTPTYGGTGTTGGLVTAGAGGTVTGTGFLNAGLTVAGGAATGHLTITGPVNIDAGAFAGSHTIHGNLTTHGACTLNPSDAPGTAETLTVVGDVSLDAATVLNYQLTTPGLLDGGGVNDFIAISGPPGAGNLTLDGTVNIAGSLPFAEGCYRLMNCTGVLTDNGLVVGSRPSSDLNYTIVAGSGHVDLVVAESSAPGDVNRDGAVNSLDIDAIYRHFGIGPAFAQWDVNGDGVVNQGDVTYELTSAAIGLKSEYGDANLDHKVNFSDFQILLDRWQTTGGTWATGDFNGDQMVNFGDFQRLLDYWNPAGYGASAPEPATVVLLGLGALGLIRRKK